MTKRPKGRKYRNLHLYRGSIWYERIWKGQRICKDTKTTDWQEAAAIRDLYEQAKGIGILVVLPDEAPTFAEMAKRYLAEALPHAKPSYRYAHTAWLSEQGHLVRHFGPIRLDEIRRAHVVDWWHQTVEARGKSERTGRNWLTALSGVFAHAIDLELVAENPADGLRATLRRRRRSARGRSVADHDSDCRCPIESPEEIERFVAASRAHWDSGKLPARRDHVADLLLLDAGIRTGEAAALRWADLEAEQIHVRRARWGEHEGLPKSGRMRKVALSRRLRLLLREWRVASGNPGAIDPVLLRWHPGNYARRHFVKMSANAELAGRHTPKCLRDTFASQLLSSGVQLAYVASQLGHADVTTTAHFRPGSMRRSASSSSPSTRSKRSTPWS